MKNIDHTLVYTTQKLNIVDLLAEYDSFYVSIITYMEVYAYDFEVAEERMLIDLLFDALEIIGIAKPLAEQAIVYRKNKTNKIKLPDALILATAKRISTTLLSGDWDDFKGIAPDINI